MSAVVKKLGLTRWFGMGLALALCLLLTSGAGLAQETTGSYVNPVSKSFADTFADPAVIKAKDGYWYAYGTTDPLREGEGRFHTIPIARSKDLVDWRHVGDAFSGPNEISWAAEGAEIGRASCRERV